LIFKLFHNKFNPFFIEQFHNKQANKIDWSLTGGLGHYPSQGLKILLVGLGISSKLSYGDDNAIDNLRRDLPVIEPVVMEEKKCHDVIEAF
jgi:hypothetical protein